VDPEFLITLVRIFTSLDYRIQLKLLRFLESTPEWKINKIIYLINKFGVPIAEISAWKYGYDFDPQ